MTDRAVGGEPPFAYPLTRVVAAVARQTEGETEAR